MFPYLSGQFKKKKPPFKEKNKGVNCSSFQNFLVREEKPVS